MMSRKDELLELRKQFRDLVDDCKFLCQCKICRLHRARDFKSMRKMRDAMEKGLVNWAGEMVKSPYQDIPG